MRIMHIKGFLKNYSITHENLGYTKIYDAVIKNCSEILNGRPLMLG